MHHIALLVKMKFLACFEASTQLHGGVESLEWLQWTGYKRLLTAPMNFKGIK